jgi:4-carboxymuconolactone decarboxylase
MLVAILMAVAVMTSAQAQEFKTMSAFNSIPVQESLQSVAPALDKYARGPVSELWKRPELNTRDRSIVTVAALIARNDALELPFYLTVALDNGVAPREISEIITHLAFYSGWPNAMTAVRAAKDAFAERKIDTDQLPAASASPLPLNEAAEADRAARVGGQFGSVAPRLVQYTTDVLFRDLWLRPDLAPRDRSLSCGADCFRSGRADAISSQPCDGQRRDAGASGGGHHAPGILCRLAECVFGAAGGEGCL